MHCVRNAVKAMPRVSVPRGRSYGRTAGNCARTGVKCAKMSRREAVEAAGAAASAVTADNTRVVH